MGIIEMGMTKISLIVHICTRRHALNMTPMDSIIWVLIVLGLIEKDVILQDLIYLANLSHQFKEIK